MKTDQIPRRTDAAGGAIRWAMLLGGASIILVIVVVLVMHGRSRSRPVIPKAPDNAVQVVVRGLAEYKPQVLWDALPASYQADVRDVIGTFCANMDPAIYTQAFRISDKAVRVLKEKRQYFAKSPVAMSIPMLESSIGKNWNHDVGILDTLVHSELSSLATLKQMDPGEFLATTGSKLMMGLEDLRLRMQHAPGLNPWEKLNQSFKESRIEFVKTSDERGFLKFTSPTNSAGKDVQLVQVEGRWVPADFAAAWKGRVAQAKEGLAKLSGPEFTKSKPMLMMVLGTIESSLDSLLKCGNQKEFDERLKGFAAIGGMVRSMKALQNRKAQ